VGLKLNVSSTIKLVNHISFRVMAGGAGLVAFEICPEPLCPSLYQCTAIIVRFIFSLIEKVLERGLFYYQICFTNKHTYLVTLLTLLTYLLTYLLT
jgi:hypothetical protein